jgi:hypothetical protein
MPKIRKDLEPIEQRGQSHFAAKTSQNWDSPRRFCNWRSAADRPGSTPMNSKATRTLLIFTALTALAGCQSGPHWAWWKHDTAPDSSAVARSAEPKLPSAQSTPQAVAVAGLTPATPPSSTNLAAAGAAAQTAPSNISIPVTSQATVAGAPSATYPAGSSLADRLTSAPNAMKPANAGAPSATVTSPAAGMVSQPLASVPPSGPYDPKAYKPASSLTSSGSDPLGASVGASVGADRYGATDRYSAAGPASSSLPVATSLADRNPAAPPTAPLPTSAATSPLASQVSPATSDRYMNPVTPAVANQGPFAAMPPLPSSSAASAPVATTLPSNLNANIPSANSTNGVHLTTAAGQYRPGGTSSYPGANATSPIEVATRPSPPAAATQPAPAQAGLPDNTSIPWAAPASPATAPATRTY